MTPGISSMVSLCGGEYWASSSSEPSINCCFPIGLSVIEIGDPPVLR
ncbi:hypothetical protein Tco_1222973, partial [Tanacetum coccineum]